MCRPCLQTPQGSGRQRPPSAEGPACSLQRTGSLWQLGIEAQELTQLQPAATRFSFPNHELSSRKSSAVVIDDEEALKAGRQITGAQLLSRRSWRIC